MKAAANKLTELTSKDIEDIQMEVSGESPSSQLHLLEISLQKVIAKELTDSAARKALDVAQTILSGVYVLLSERALMEYFCNILEFSASEDSDDLVERAVSISSALLIRMRNARARLPPVAGQWLHKIRRDGQSKRVGVLIDTMENRIREASNRLNAPMVRRSFDLPDLDVKQAVKNVREDVRGDWYQDPWDWPELEWLSGAGAKFVAERLRNDGLDWTLPIDVPKQDGRMRPGLVINPCDRVAYQSLVDDMALDVAGELPDWVHGWRLKRNARLSRALYEPNRAEWKRFSQRVADFGERYKYTAHIDIENFFPTVNVDILLAGITRTYRNVAVTDRLEQFLQMWNDVPHGGGIPQRSLASSVLAHAVLKPVDIYLERARRGSHEQGFEASRWMDDIWIHSNSEKHLRNIVAEIQGIIGQSKLSLNAAKTEVFEGKDDERILNIDDLYGEEEADHPEEGSTLKRLLDETEGGAPAFFVSWLISRIRATKDWKQLREISPAQFPQILHLGNQFAQAFRTAGVWRKFRPIYLKFAKEHVADDNLATATWGEMFPSQASSGLREIELFFVDQLNGFTQRVLSPLAAYRLASWCAEYVDSQLIDRTLELRDTFQLRGVCMAALTAGVGKDTVAKALNESGDIVVLEYLSSRRWKMPDPAARLVPE